jgi:hypothetical protein
VCPLDGLSTWLGLDLMRALYVEDPNNMEALYGRYKSYNNMFAHFTPRGNREVAMAVAGALNADLAKGIATDYHLEAFVPGDGQNLIPSSETLEELIAGAPGVLFHTIRSRNQPQVRRRSFKSARQVPEATIICRSSRLR